MEDDFLHWYTVCRSWPCPRLKPLACCAQAFIERSQRSRALLAGHQVASVRDLLVYCKCTRSTQRSDYRMNRSTPMGTSSGYEPVLHKRHLPWHHFRHGPVKDRTGRTGTRPGVVRVAMSGQKHSPIVGQRQTLKGHCIETWIVWGVRTV